MAFVASLAVSPTYRGYALTAFDLWLHSYYNKLTRIYHQSPPDDFLPLLGQDFPEKVYFPSGYCLGTLPHSLLSIVVM